MNKIVLTGRITANVELKQTPNGVSVCQFCIAVKRPHTTDKTDFFNCVAWRSTAEFISRYFEKGKMIAISGCLTNRTYEDKNNVKHTISEIIVDEAEFCGDKAKNEAPQTTTPQNPQFEEIKDDSDLPF